jgi:lipoyl(octanoyl) transferase
MSALSNFPSESLEQNVSCDPVDYLLAIDVMKARVSAIHKGEASGLLWFLEHPSLYTAGTSAKDADLLSTYDFPVFEASRGGQYTYHGPGQLVIYCMVDLREIALDVRQYVKLLEHWVLDVLQIHGVQGALYPDRIGVWVMHTETKKESKIAAIGVRVTHGITWHGLSFNISPNLEHYRGIIPCGISDFGVTSLLDLGIKSCFNDIVCDFLATMPVQFSKNTNY